MNCPLVCLPLSNDQCSKDSSHSLCRALKLRSRPPFTGAPRTPSQKMPRSVLLECFWASASERPKECSELDTQQGGHATKRFLEGFLEGFLELRFRRARTGHKSPPRWEIRKKYEKITESPTLGGSPKARKND